MDMNNVDFFRALVLLQSVAILSGLFLFVVPQGKRGRAAIKLGGLLLLAFGVSKLASELGVPLSVTVLTTIGAGFVWLVVDTWKIGRNSRKNPGNRDTLVDEGFIPFDDAGRAHFAAFGRNAMSTGDEAGCSAPRPLVSRPDKDGLLFSPEEIKRTASGEFWHPDLFKLSAADRTLQGLAHRGYEGRWVYGTDEDFPEVVCIEGGARYLKALKEWQPKPPEGSDWKLAAITDTDDGAAALFVRPFDSYDNLGREGEYEDACQKYGRFQQCADLRHDIAAGRFKDLEELQEHLAQCEAARLKEYNDYFFPNMPGADED